MNKTTSAKYKRAFIHGYSMSLRVDDSGISTVLEKKLPLGAKWHREPEFMDVLEEELSEKNIFFDLGSNIGYVTLFVLSQLSKNSVVYCVEPDIKNCSVLQDTLCRNGLTDRVHLDNCAISDKTGIVQLNISTHSNMHTICDAGDSIGAVDVQSYSFDDYIEKVGFMPNFIKMDIEGAETLVVQGMTRYLSNVTESKILMEVHPSQYRSDDFDKMCTILERNGFVPKIVISAGSATPTPFKKIHKSPYKKYTSGKWGRGLYRNISMNELKQLVNNSDENYYIYNPWFLIRHPSYIVCPYFKTKKVVRAVLFEKKL